MKSRLGLGDADGASWSVSSSPLTELMFLYPAACHCVTLASTHHFGLYWTAGLRD